MSEVKAKQKKKASKDLTKQKIKDQKPEDESGHTKK